MDSSCKVATLDAWIPVLKLPKKVIHHIHISGKDSKNS